MIGAETGKVINYAVRSISCRVCENATNLKPGAHDCRKILKAALKVWNQTWWCQWLRT